MMAKLRQGLARGAGRRAAKVAPTGVLSSLSYLAGSASSESPYLRIDLAEFVDVGVSEHTVNVCAMPCANDPIPTQSSRVVCRVIA